MEGRSVVLLDGGGAAGEVYHTSHQVLAAEPPWYCREIDGGAVGGWRRESSARRGIGRAKEPANRSVVFTRDEERGPGTLEQVRSAMASRLYGSGLELME
jgi:hypothetical protein